MKTVNLLRRFQGAQPALAFALALLLALAAGNAAAQDGSAALSLENAKAAWKLQLVSTVKKLSLEKVRASFSLTQWTQPVAPTPGPTGTKAASSRVARNTVRAIRSCRVTGAVESASVDAEASDSV